MAFLWGGRSIAAVFRGACTCKHTVVPTQQGPYLKHSAHSCPFRALPPSRYPDHRAQELSRSLQRAEAFIRSIQRQDGSWWVWIKSCVKPRGMLEGVSAVAICSIQRNGVVGVDKAMWAKGWVCFKVGCRVHASAWARGDRYTATTHNR